MGRTTETLMKMMGLKDASVVSEGSVESAVQMGR